VDYPCRHNPIPVDLGVGTSQSPLAGVRLTDFGDEWSIPKPQVGEGYSSRLCHWAQPWARSGAVTCSVRDWLKSSALHRDDSLRQLGPALAWPPQHGCDGASTGVGCVYRSGQQSFVPFFHDLIADIEAHANGARALTRIDEAVDFAGKTGEHWSDAFSSSLARRDSAQARSGELRHQPRRHRSRLPQLRNSSRPAVLSCQLSLVCHDFIASQTVPQTAHVLLASALEGISPTLEFPEIEEAQALLVALTS
jgi:hypothetical protein